LKSYLFILFLLAVPFAASAQLISNPNPPVPAALAVGGAYTAAANGAEAIYWNPAGLAYGKGTDTRFAYQKPWNVGFLTHLSASASTMLPSRKHGFAVGVQTLGTRDGGTTMASETEVSLAHGFMLQQDIHSSLAFGYAVKLINYSLGESVVNGTNPAMDLGSAMTFGLDVGATAQLWDRFKLGAAFKNINRPQMGADSKRNLPQVFMGGLSYTPYYGVRTTFDLERVISGETQFKGGLNATVVKPLDLRFGVTSNPNCFTAGFGLHYRELVLDYAFVYHPVLSPSHLVGIGFNLDQTLPEIWQAKK